MADYEIKLLIKEYIKIKEVILDIARILEKIVLTIPGTKNLLEIKGVGIRTFAGLFAGIGDIRRSRSAKRIIKLAGLDLKSNSLGNHSSSLLKR